MRANARPWLALQRLALQAAPHPQPSAQSLHSGGVRPWSGVPPPWPSSSPESLQQRGPSPVVWQSQGQVEQVRLSRQVPSCTWRFSAGSSGDTEAQ